MTYRGPQSQRQQAQFNEILPYAGFTALWRSYVSASAGADVAGFGSTYYYAERTITAVFTLGRFAGAGRISQGFTPAGALEAGQLYVVAPVKLQKNDELIWRGSTYRVDSDPVPGTLDNTWVAIVARGDA